jgi:hypothetical protein
MFMRKKMREWLAEELRNADAEVCRGENWDA